MLDPAHTARLERRAAARGAAIRRRRKVFAVAASSAFVVATLLLSALFASSPHHSPPRAAPAPASAASGGPLAPASVGGLAALWAPQNIVGGQPGTAAAYSAASRLPGLPGFLLVADRGNNRILVIDPRGHQVFLYPSPADIAAGRKLFYNDDTFVEPGGRYLIAIALVEFSRPPNNYFDAELIGAIADAYERLDEDPDCRAIVLCSAGRHFCAGADFLSGNPAGEGLYEEAVRLFEARTPVVAAVQGAAIGGGLGVALSADFRVGSPGSRFSANFARPGIHHGFGLTVTLPLVVGYQRALELLYTGERLRGEQALEIGLCDRLVPDEDPREEAAEFAAAIAASAPLAVRSIRSTLRGDLADRVRVATAHEAAEQASLFATEDFQEGVAATAERREAEFQGR